MTLHDIHLRDPFVLADAGQYYLYGTNGPNPWDNEMGFDAYVSSDLLTWSGPVPVFRPADDFWANQSFWAPEVFAHDGKYYMCASFTQTHWSHRRGTQVLVAPSPLGPFTPHSDGPVTPHGDVCIDGTLFWDSEQQPWMIYCHERMQVTDGGMCAIRLTPDLRQSMGEKHHLFNASAAQWTDAIDGNQYTTDGPFLYQSKSGDLLLLWSSFHRGNYSVGVARSASGNVLGPWMHDAAPLYKADGGHAMIFRTFEGRAMLALHAPGMTMGMERTQLFLLNDTSGELHLSPRHEPEPGRVLPMEMPAARLPALTGAAYH